MLLYKSSASREIVMKFAQKQCITIVSDRFVHPHPSSSRCFPGENPQFNETFEFELAFPELALVRFVVLDDDSLDYDFIGQFTIPFESIQPGDFSIEYSSFSSTMSLLGYRHVHLYTIGGDLIANAYLFIHIVINSKSCAVVSAAFDW